MRCPYCRQKCTDIKVYKLSSYGKDGHAKITRCGKTPLKIGAKKRVCENCEWQFGDDNAFIWKKENRLF